MRTSKFGRPYVCGVGVVLSLVFKLSFFQIAFGQRSKQVSTAGTFLVASPGTPHYPCESELQSFTLTSGPKYMLQDYFCMLSSHGMTITAVSNPEGFAETRSQTAIAPPDLLMFNLTRRDSQQPGRSPYSHQILSSSTSTHIH